MRLHCKFIPISSHVSIFCFITAKTYRYVSVADNKTLQQLISIESQLEKLYARPDPSMKDDENKFLTILSDLADRELVITISWAKQVPGRYNAQVFFFALFFFSHFFCFLCLFNDKQDFSPIRTNCITLFLV